MSQFGEVWVVGIGVGYHLLELKRRWPHLRLVACDTKEELHQQAGQNHNGRSLAKLELSQLFYGEKACAVALEKIPRGPILRFRPACFASEEKVFESLRAHSPRAFLSSAQRQGYQSFTANFKHFPDVLAVNIKSLPNSSDPSSSESKIHDLLKELIR